MPCSEDGGRGGLQLHQGVLQLLYLPVTGDQTKTSHIQPVLYCNSGPVRAAWGGPQLAQGTHHFRPNQGSAAAGRVLRGRGGNHHGFVLLGFISIILYALVFSPHVCPWDWSHRQCELPHGCWEPNVGPLEEQPALLTAEPAPQPSTLFLSNCLGYCFLEPPPASAFRAAGMSGVHHYTQEN